MPNINIRITDLPPVSSSTHIASDDVLPIVDISENTTKKVTAEQLVGYVTGNLALTGEVTSVGNVTTISTNAVDFNQIQQVTGPVFIGRQTATHGDISALSVSQAKGMIGNFSTSINGLVPASPGGTATFLRADGQWEEPPTGITTETQVTVATSVGDILSASNHQISAKDAGASDKLVFWDNSANKLTYLALGSGLQINSTDLNVTAASPTNSVQFNNAGTFGGSNKFTWNNSTEQLNIQGKTSIIVEQATPFKKSTVDITTTGSFFTFQNSSSQNSTSSLQLYNNGVELGYLNAQLTGNYFSADSNGSYLVHQVGSGIYSAYAYVSVNDLNTINLTTPFSSGYVQTSFGMRIGTEANPSINLGTNQSKIFWAPTIKNRPAGAPVLWDEDNGELYLHSTLFDISGNYLGSGFTPPPIYGYLPVLPSYSDIRLKTNIQQIQQSLEKIKAIRGVYFDFIESPETTGFTGKQIGVIADEVETVLPELVSQNTNGYKMVDYAKLTSILIEAIKDIDNRLADLEKKIL